MAETEHHSLGADLIAEAEAWRNRVTTWLGGGATLVHVSAHSSDVRIYRLDQRVLKVRRVTPASGQDRLNTLEDEYRYLGRLETFRGVLRWDFPKAVRYVSGHGWEAFEMDAIALPVKSDPVVRPFQENWSDLWRLAGAVWHLNWVGVSHGDLKPANAGPNEEGRLVLLDFDQAVRAGLVTCLLRDCLGLSCGKGKVQYSLRTRLCQLPALRWWTRFRRWQRAGRAGEAVSLDVGTPGTADQEMAALARCWQEAAGSGANSPGGGVAYYSIDVRGCHFPGERPWALRWEMFAGRIEFRGKRMVELGCNMALLSIWARLSGARAVRGADINHGILGAAGRLAALCGAEVDLRRIDFDQDQDWERTLGEGDIVTALSLTYWLRDKERVWRYLATFPEVVFEGHEAETEIRDSFRAWGFTQVESLGLSERNRIVFHARRATQEPGERNSSTS